LKTWLLMIVMARLITAENHYVSKMVSDISEFTTEEISATKMMNRSGQEVK